MELQKNLKIIYNMEGKQIKLLITDFDGTLVDTFKANYMAYKKAFEENDLTLTEADYRQCFGLRFENFMAAMNIKEGSLQKKIREIKSQCYPNYFDYFRINHTLLNIIKSFKNAGGSTAIASTARKSNLENALRYINAIDDFHYILAGEEVTNGKPSPEIYLKVLKHFNRQPHEAIVFEDSEVGIKAAQAAGINYIIINPCYYGN